VTRLLNEYLEEMTGIVRKWGGTIPQFTVDAIFAIFGVPDSRGDREDDVACVRMALNMQVPLRVLRDKWWMEGIQFPFAIRCRIHTGMANVSNYGSEALMEYSAIGLNTNLASRIEHVCEPGEIYVSHTTSVLIQNIILCVEVGTIEGKGFHFPIRTYKVSQKMA